MGDSPGLYVSASAKGSLLGPKPGKAQGPIDFLRILIFYLFFFFIQPSGYFWGP